MGTAAWAQDAPDLKAQCETGLQAIAAAQAVIAGMRGHYASRDELLEVNSAFIGEEAKDLLQDGSASPVHFTVAASRDGSRFYAVGWFGREFTAFSIDETGMVKELPEAASAQTLIDMLMLDNFFAAKPQWAGQAEAIVKQQLHQVQLALERWSVDNSAEGDALYPETLEPIVTHQYVRTGFYANPWTAWNAQELDAAVVPVGQWSPGNFSYIPFIEDGACRGYLLACYSCRRTAGPDYNGDGSGDGYLLVLTSGNISSQWAARELAGGH